MRRARAPATMASRRPSRKSSSCDCAPLSSGVVVVDHWRPRKKLSWRTCVSLVEPVTPPSPMPSVNPVRSRCHVVPIRRPPKIALMERRACATARASGLPDAAAASVAALSQEPAASRPARRFSTKLAAKSSASAPTCSGFSAMAFFKPALSRSKNTGRPALIPSRVA